MENIASLVFAIIYGLFSSCTVLQAFWKWKLQFRVFSWDAFIEGLRPRQLWQVTDWNIKLPNILRKESCSSSCLSPFPWQTQIHDPPLHSHTTHNYSGHTIGGLRLCVCLTAVPYITKQWSRRNGFDHWWNYNPSHGLDECVSLLSVRACKVLWWWPCWCLSERVDNTT